MTSPQNGKNWTIGTTRRIPTAVIPDNLRRNSSKSCTGKEVTAGGTRIRWKIKSGIPVGILLI
jgi:hypothetical protein